MATVFRLTWKDEQGGRWRKKYKGQQYSFRRKPGETKETSYRRCWAEWLKKKDEIDASDQTEEPWRRAISNLIAETRDQLAEAQLEDTPENRERWVELIEQLRRYEYDLAHDENPFQDTDDQGNPTDYWEGNPDDFCSDDDPPPWAPGGAGSAMNSEFYTLTATPVETLEGNVKRFLKRKELQAERGERSRGRVEVLRVGLESFVKLAGADVSITSVTASLLSRFRDELESLVSEGKLKPHSARDRLQAVKQFVRWAWEEELIGLPRILQSREFSIALPEQRIETFTDVEVQRLIGAASETTKLYLLLFLNCGMTQGDIADLLQTEVDWDKGRINRKRSKTRKACDNVPSVVYPLWPETFRLLTQCRSKHARLALTNQKGEPLKVETTVNGKAKKIDNVHSSYCRLITKLAAAKTDPIKIDKPLKLLRKTAATKLGQNPTYGRFAQYFLGHAPTTMADRHYVAPSQDQFDEAVAWLGTQILVSTPD